MATAAPVSGHPTGKTFTVSILSYLPEKIHCEMTANIEVHFLSHYQHRLQCDLEGRGLFGVTEGELKVNCVVSRASSEEQMSKGEALGRGDAFIILHDDETLEEAEVLNEKLLKEDRGKMVPVFMKLIATKPRRGKISLGCECCQNPRDVLFADVFEKLCAKVKLDAGFIAPPKRATRCERQSRLKRVVGRVKRRISIC